MWQVLSEIWVWLLALGGACAALAASVHAVLNKRDTRATIAWVGLIWLTPLLGSFLYFCFGINRIRRRGQNLRSGDSRPLDSLETPLDDVLPPEVVERNPNIIGLARLTSTLTDRPLVYGNRVDLLVNGDEAMPAMLAAIDGAGHSISLLSYIFDNDRAGRMFGEALRRAVDRGVTVRVLIDDVGSRYTRPTMIRVLAEQGVPVRSFLPTRVPRMFNYANLRNHRKLLIVDGKHGFTGGLNIREGNMLSWNPSCPVQDIHFRIEGPVVSHMQEAFAVDWAFTGGEDLAPEDYYTDIAVAGETWARGITDGPDDDFEKFQLTVQGALAAASESVYVVTPYFLPEAALSSALCVAAMRGINVNIILPQQSNIRLVQWATMPYLDDLLERGCRVWLTPPPFDHAKMVVVDRLWSLIGSANWDARSLSLNFEFNVECYDEKLAERLAELAEAKMDAARELTLEELNSRPLWMRLRDGTVRLAAPYL